MQLQLRRDWCDLQGILDNLIKYAPAGSRATVVFDEDKEKVVLKFISLGPKVEVAEYEKIFLPGFRAAAARAKVTTGLGIGLAVAKTVSDSLELDLAISQRPDEDRMFRSHFETTFSIRLERVSDGDS